MWFRGQVNAALSVILFYSIEITSVRAKQTRHFINPTLIFPVKKTLVSVVFIATLLDSTGRNNKDPWLLQKYISRNHHSVTTYRSKPHKKLYMPHLNKLLLHLLLQPPVLIWPLTTCVVLFKVLLVSKGEFLIVCVKL